MSFQNMIQEFFLRLKFPLENKLAIFKAVEEAETVKIGLKDYFWDKKNVLEVIFYFNLISDQCLIKRTYLPALIESAGM